jgi:hypothetical protein
MSSWSDSLHGVVVVELHLAPSLRFLALSLLSSLPKLSLLLLRVLTGICVRCVVQHG